MAAHRRSMRNTIRRSKERQDLRDLEDERYRASCPRPHGKGSPRPFIVFADIADAWINMFSYCRPSDKVLVRNTMVPRGRKVKTREWGELNEGKTVGFNPMVEATLVGTKDERFQEAEGGEDSLFFTHEDSMKVRRELSSGKQREEWLKLLAETRLKAECERAAVHPAQNLGDGGIVSAERLREYEEQEALALAKRKEGWLKIKKKYRKHKEEWRKVRADIRWCMETETETAPEPQLSLC